MLPEISRRCSSCGASIRERDALFCPECGKPLPASADSAEQTEPIQSQTDTKAESVKVTPASPPSESVDAPNAPNASAPSGEGASPSKTETPDVVTEHAVVSPTNPPNADQDVSARAHPRMERTRETLHRASTMARGVIDDEVKRVEKIRHVSSVVIEEASYDPSLRFVLVALGLFIVFLILLILSKVMG